MDFFHIRPAEKSAYRHLSGSLKKQQHFIFIYYIFFIILRLVLCPKYIGYKKHQQINETYIRKSKIHLMHPLFYIFFAKISFFVNPPNIAAKSSNAASAFNPRHENSSILISLLISFNKFPLYSNDFFCISSG